MKRGTIIFLSIFLISLASATPEIKFQHNETQPGETIFATITTTGEFSKDITESDITFLEGRKNVFFEFDLTYFNGTYHFYTYTTRAGNFTLKISDILYNESGNLESSTLEKDFIIKQESIIEENTTSTKILSIKPGFIKSSEELKITLTNKGNSSLEITCSDQELILQPSESETITFEQEFQFELFLCSTYKEFLVPVIRPKPGDIIIPEIIHDLKSDPESILLNITIGEPQETQIQLFNFGDDNLTNIQITSNFDFIKTETLDNFEGKQIQNLPLTISPELPGHFEGTLNITYIQNNKTKTLPIILDFFILPSGSNISDFQISDLSCAELNGNICKSGEEICNGTAEFTGTGEYCCQGNCVAKEIEKESGRGYGWLIGILIFLAIAGAGFYLYKRQKKIGPQKPEEQMKETSKKLDERTKGIQDTKRVSGGLQRT